MQIKNNKYNGQKVSSLLSCSCYKLVFIVYYIEWDTESKINTILLLILVLTEGIVGLGREVKNVLLRVVAEEAGHEREKDGGAGLEIDAQSQGKGPHEIVVDLAKGTGIETELGVTEREVSQEIGIEEIGTEIRSGIKREGELGIILVNFYIVLNYLFRGSSKERKKSSRKQSRSKSKSPEKKDDAKESNSLPFDSATLDKVCLSMYLDY